MEDPEADFSDQPRAHRVRRGSIVNELIARDAILISKLRSDVLWWLVYEAALFAMVLTVMFIESDISKAVIEYQISFLAINGIVFALKFVLVCCRAYKRPLKKTKLI